MGLFSGQILCLYITIAVFYICAVEKSNGQLCYNKCEWLEWGSWSCSCEGRKIRTRKLCCDRWTFDVSSCLSNCGKSRSGSEDTSAIPCARPSSCPYLDVPSILKIAGGVVAGLVGLIALIGCFVRYKLRQRPQAASPNAGIVVLSDGNIGNRSRGADTSHLNYPRTPMAYGNVTYASESLAQGPPLAYNTPTRI